MTDSIVSFAGSMSEYFSLVVVTRAAAVVGTTSGADLGTVMVGTAIGDVIVTVDCRIGF